MDSTIFEPTDKDMKLQYPELGTVSEFLALSNRELAFVWYYANRTSPYINYKENEKVAAALKFSKLGATLSEEKLYKFRQSEFTEGINLAIAKMKSFRPEPRVKARNMVQTMLENLEKMIMIDQDIIQMMDLSQKKEYSTFVKNVNDVLPDLVNRVEDSFGVRMKKDGHKEKQGSTLMDKAIHEGN